MLHRVQGQIVDRLGEKCRREFDGIVEGRKVVERLNELEGLIGEAGARRKEGGEPGVAYVSIFFSFFLLVLFCSCSTHGLFLPV